MIRCLICAAAEPTALAALARGWTSRMLTRPVTYRSLFGGPTGETPAGEHPLCPTCAAWLADHRDRMLPPAVLHTIDGIIEAQEEAEGTAYPPDTARRVRMEMVGMFRHLADALTANPPSVREADG